MESQLKVYPSRNDFVRYFKNACFRLTEFHAYSLKRFQSMEELIKITVKKLWSMFRSISGEALKKGVEKLIHHKEKVGALVWNDELITLIVGRK